MSNGQVNNVLGKPLLYLHKRYSHMDKRILETILADQAEELALRGLWLGKIVATFIYISFRLYTVPAVEFVHEQGRSRYCDYKPPRFGIVAFVEYTARKQGEAFY